MIDAANEAVHRGPPELSREPDIRQPLFFVSHAITYPAAMDNSELDPNELLWTFFADLSRNVSQLVYRPPGADPGFIDRTTTTGADWERVILSALGNCQVFVALVSDPYAHREWCGKEWQAFARRAAWHRRERKPVDNPCLIPVLWAPIRPDRRPEAIGSRQFFVPKQPADIGPLYRREGVYGLFRSDHREAYEVVVWQLARMISDCVFDYWVEPEIAPGIEDLHNVFAEGRAE